jgi:prepilin-type N-terminal cleavage/methylation domain-containing protein
MSRRAFTLIELLLVIAIIALLVGLALPGLASARRSAKIVACSARLQQLGVALQMYLNDYDRTLPQLGVPVPPTNEKRIIGALFGGKKGTLPAYGIDVYGAERRPLSRYVHGAAVPPDAEAGAIELPAFQSPCDAGGNIPFVGPVRSMYDLLGSSYTLNDHALDGEDAWTLVPPGGGKMPTVVTPTKTWVLGPHPIYNHQQGGDRGMRWYGRPTAAATLLFVDLHAGGLFNVPAGVVNTTDDYTFLPRPGWSTP